VLLRLEAHARRTRSLTTPAATATHKPIFHIAVVEKLIEALSFRQIGVVREDYAVSSDSMKMFGVIDLSSGFEGCLFHADCPIMPTIYGYSLLGGARGTY
jgi:hypothetical protein